MKYTIALLVLFVSFPCMGQIIYSQLVDVMVNDTRKEFIENLFEDGFLIASEHETYDLFVFHPDKELIAKSDPGLRGDFNAGEEYYLHQLINY